MNGYVCLWNRQRLEVYAGTTIEARDKALAEFQRKAGRKKVRPYDVMVVLAEKDGEEVQHIAVD